MHACVCVSSEHYGVCVEVSFHSGVDSLFHHMSFRWSGLAAKCLYSLSHFNNSAESVKNCLNDIFSSGTSLLSSPLCGFHRPCYLGTLLLGSEGMCWVLTCYFWLV